MLAFSKQEQKFVLLLVVALLVGSGFQYYKKKHPGKVSDEWILQYQEILKDFREKSNEIASESDIDGTEESGSQQVITATEKQRFVGKINLNSATCEELQSLPGIGPATASKIIEFRSSVGPYQALEDLQKVKGIGPQKFAKIKPYITLE